MTNSLLSRVVREIETDRDRDRQRQREKGGQEGRVWERNKDRE